MAQVGAITGKITADPNGLIQGFARSKREVQQFERKFTSSTRSVGGAVQNMAVDLAISGDVGAREFKRLTESALGFAMVFGPTGALIGGIGLTLTTLLTFHERAREEVAKTKEKYDKMFAGLVGAGVPAVSAKAAEFERENGATINKLEAQLDAFRAKQQQFERGGVTLLGAAGPGANRALQGYAADIKRIEAQLTPLLDTRRRLAQAAIDEANAALRLRQAEEQITRLQKARQQAQAQALHLSELRNVEGPKLREAITQEGIARMASQASGTAEIDRLTGVAARLEPKKVAGFDQAMRDIQMFATDLTSEAGQLEQKFNMVKAGALTAAEAMGQGLRGAVTNLTQAMISAAASIGASVAGGGRSAGIGGLLGAAIGGKFGETKIAGLFGTGKIGSFLGGALGGPIGAMLGSISGAMIGKAVGGLVKGVGRLFGFGKKKRGPSAEELAAQQLQRLAKAAREAAEALSNIPRGFKVALFQYMAADPVRPPARREPPRDDRRSRPGEGSGRGRSDRGSSGTAGGGRTESAAAAGFTNYGTITVVANDPKEFFEKLERGRYTTDRGGVSHVQRFAIP